MPDFYRLVSTTNPNTDWTNEIVLAVDEDGEPTKVVSTGIPVQLNAEDRKKVEALGFALETTTKEEAEKAQASGGAVAGDTAHSAPTLGGSQAANQKTDQTK